MDDEGKIWLGFWQAYPSTIWRVDAQARLEFSELKKIKVDFGFGLCIDGKSLQDINKGFTF